MTRHDDIPPFARVISPNRPSVRGNQARMIAEIEQWLKQDERELRKERFYRKFETYFTTAMLALIAILGVALVAYNAWRVIF